MFRYSMRLSSGSSLFISLSKLLILKTIKIFKKFYQLFSYTEPDDNTFLSILVVFNISNFDEEINKEIPEDDLIEYRNMLEYFLKCFKWF